MGHVGEARWAAPAALSFLVLPCRPLFYLAALPSLVNKKTSIIYTKI